VRNLYRGGLTQRRGAGRAAWRRALGETSSRQWVAVELAVEQR